MVAACLLAQAVVAKEVLDVRLDAASQLSALWVYLVYAWSGDRSRRTERLYMTAAVVVSVAVLALYAVG